MAIPNVTKREIPPTHPGEMIREDFMPDYGLSTASLADAIGVSRQTINELLRERRAIGNSPEFWLNAQHARDLWESEQHFQEELKKIHPLNAA
ncbi:MAG: HigA family addiction module antidote protein [Deltaproteobacteria bacterium]|nr:HigA family addiction module antidote protein [Deltaproteobacteria bacterium]